MPSVLSCSGWRRASGVRFYRQETVSTHFWNELKLLLQNFFSAATAVAPTASFPTLNVLKGYLTIEE